MIRVVIHWSFFGPFHLARLTAAFDMLRKLDIEVVGLEMTTHKNLFAWDRDDTPKLFRRYVAWPGETYEQLSPIKKWKGMFAKLDVINPNVVAINGYSDFDALGALAWCKIHRRGAVIMSDSKSDDALRSTHKELLKGQIVRQFNSAICAGKCSRNYLETLGMHSNLIFEGLDAVDNDFFSSEAKKAKINQYVVRSLPGLESKKPFFLAVSRLITEKNIDGLIRAYSQYRLVMAKKGWTPWRLVILGEGTERRALECLVETKKVQEVSFGGFHQINELPIYYGLASVFIHPTWREPWALVVNEAMASGLPVLISKGAGCAQDLVEEGKNGYTFAPEDSEALTDLMVLMSSNQIDLEMMGKEAQARVSQWGVQRFSQGLYQAVKTAIQ